MSDAGTAIITYGRSLMSVVVARSLASRGVKVISCDSVSMTAASFSKFTSDNFIHADIDDDPEQYLEDILSIVRKHRPTSGQPYVLMPVFRDAKFLSKHRARFEGLIEVAAPAFAAIDKIDPKHHLLSTLENLDIAAPRSWHPLDESDLEDALKKVEMPALLKAVDEVGGRGIEFFEDKQEMKTRAKERLKDETPPPLIQQTAKGDDYCLCVLYRDGVRYAHMAYNNLQTMPRDGGAGSMRQTIDDAPFLKAADSIMGKVKWTGVAEIDFMWTGNVNDEPVLIEINPRFWAGLFQSVESGVDFPWLLFKLFGEGSIEKAPEAEIGTKTKIPGVWLAGALADAFEGSDDESQTYWDKLVSAFQGGEFSTSLKILGRAFKDVTDFDDAIALISQQSKHAEDAKSELMLSEDPATSLGVFFILSSLLKTGKLPPELSN